MVLPPAHGRVACVLACVLLLFCALAFAEPMDPASERAEGVFPGARLSEPEGEFRIRTLTRDGEPLGYLFESRDVLDMPAYSGKPINLQIILDRQGVIRDAHVLEHHEPILLVGIPEQKLHDFSAHYQGIAVGQRVVVGRSRDPEAVTVDAVTGATVTVMVVNETVMGAARKVALSLGLIEGGTRSKGARARIRQGDSGASGWRTLTGNGAVRRLHLTRGQVDEAFQGTEAEGVDEASPVQRDDTFIDLYTTLLNPPAVGRGLLGDAHYEDLMAGLDEGEYAIAVLANGLWSFKGSGYVRGGIFDRVQLRQDGALISFRDLDYGRLSDVYARGMPAFSEMATFIIREEHGFDPGTPWTLELLVRRQTGPVSGLFTSFELPYQTPERYLERPVAAADEGEPAPVWVHIWYQKQFQVAVIGVALMVLLAILFLQDRLVRHPRFLHGVRRGYLAFTVVFIGWYALEQLSVVNVLTFAHAVMADFRWGLFLSDPVIFVLWVFTAASVLLWGRGVFCGWLCPFGALQELLNEAARKLRVVQYELPFAVHERLWAVKYLILLVLFGLSLESMANAERLAEVEPFKTAITLKFDRQWGFVLYAVALLGVNLFTRKAYCRYLCPLGAALAVPSKLRLFDWLKRRKECGNPCQLCANECEIQAIHPDGRINVNECHYCLDCQMTYHNDNKCPPLIVKKKRASKNKRSAGGPERISALQLEEG